MKKRLYPATIILVACLIAFPKAVLYELPFPGLHLFYCHAAVAFIHLIRKSLPDILKLLEVLAPDIAHQFEMP